VGFKHADILFFANVFAITWWCISSLKENLIAEENTLYESCDFISGQTMASTVHCLISYVCIRKVNDGFTWNVSSFCCWM